MTNELASFLREAFSFMEEMLTEALEHPELQAVCVSDMAGHIRQIRDRLPQDETFQAQVMLSIDEITRPDWREWWTKFGVTEREKFEVEAGEMLIYLGVLKRGLHTGN